jgi:hypothetical protein
MENKREFTMKLFLALLNMIWGASGKMDYQHGKEKSLFESINKVVQG